MVPRNVSVKRKPGFIGRATGAVVFLHKSGIEHGALAGLAPGFIGRGEGERNLRIFPNEAFTNGAFLGLVIQSSTIRRGGADENRSRRPCGVRPLAGTL
jgi:hypothetical protein